MTRPILLSGLLLAGAALPALAQTPAAHPVVQHVRGTVQSLTGDKLVVKSASGDTQSVMLAPGWTAVSVVPTKLAAIKPGSFIGTAATGPSSHLVAREVVVFPPAMKGTGEGHYAWDLGPQSTMTNATVNAEVKRSSGRELTLKYKGGTTKVLVPANVPVVTFAPGATSMVTPGAHVFIGATEANGTLTTSHVAVGKDGMTPPM